jgi:adenylate kinase family enzyme
MENNLKIIIHISGASGSGKTFLGNQLKKQFKKKIIVKDLDDLRDEFIEIFYGKKEWKYINEKEYQNFINNFIYKNKKSIVFVGLSDNTAYGKNKNLYYDLQSQYNYYIKLDDTIILKQKCLRLLNDIQNDKTAMNDLIENNEHFIEMFSQAIKRECSLKDTIKINNKWKEDYEKQGYKIMTSEKIFQDVSKILAKDFNIIDIKCNFCKSPNIFGKCGDCLKIFYCEKKCQEKDFKEHQNYCEEKI